MKKFAAIVFIIFSFFALSLRAQDIKEVDGVFYKNNTPYTGSYLVKYDNGNPKIEMNLIDGLKTGIVKVYFEDKKLNEIRSYKDNKMHGSWITYNREGIQIGLANYTDGLKDGEWKIWDSEGNLLYELYYDKGEKTGTWIRYGTNGEVTSKRKYPDK